MRPGGSPRRTLVGRLAQFVGPYRPNRAGLKGLDLKKPILCLAFMTVAVNSVCLAIGADATASAPDVPRTLTTGQAAGPVAVESAWDEAFTRRDVRALAAIFADNFVQLGDDGTVMTKTQLLRSVGMLTMIGETSFTTERFVRITGDAATITGIYVQDGRVSRTDARRYRLKIRYADVYSRTTGKWKAVLGFGHVLSYKIRK